MDNKRKRDDELLADTDYIPSKLMKEKTSHELRTPKSESGHLLNETESPKIIADFSESTPKGTGIKIIVSRTLSDSKLHKKSSSNLAAALTPTIGSRLRKSLTPSGTGRKVLNEIKTPNGRKSLTDLKTPNGRKGLSELKTPQGTGLELKTPKSKSAKKGRMWCSDCTAEAGSGCAEHRRLDLETARQQAAATLRAAQDTLHRLDELVQKRAPRLRCTVAAVSRPDDPEEAVRKEDIEVALASTRLSEQERRALCAYLEGLVLEPDREHLSASSAGCEAIATKCAKLPDRPEGVMLKAGAILLLGTCDSLEVSTGALQDAEESDSSDEEDRNKSWLGDAPPALRIYYEKAVMPHQGRGAKVLGYIVHNLSFLAAAKDRASDSAAGEEETSTGFSVLLSNVTFM